MDNTVGAIFTRVDVVPCYVTARIVVQTALSCFVAVECWEKFNLLLRGNTRN